MTEWCVSLEVYFHSKKSLSHCCKQGDTRGRAVCVFPGCAWENVLDWEIYSLFSLLPFYYLLALLNLPLRVI